MGKYRKRFNEKARSGMLAKQAALKSARNKQFTRHEADGTDEIVENESQENNEDPNSEILKALTDQEKKERKRKMEEMIYSANEKESKMSRTKKKRLDKVHRASVKERREKSIVREIIGDENGF